jgi:hypothetical protein
MGYRTAATTVPQQVTGLSVGYGAHGERAVTAISILERAAFEPLLSLKGGFSAWTAAGCPIAGSGHPAS